LLFRRGRAEFDSGHSLPVFPQAVPIATQIPHATGAGMAMNYREGGDGAVVCYFGDGATSEGDFHEGLNFAGVFETPTVFFCENNNWAISLPRSRQTAAASIADRAQAYGFAGGQVDGNDPLAVLEFVGSALTKARNGNPVLVESLTYRQGAHTTSDDPSRYRDEESDLPRWRTRDPLDRYEAYLRDQGLVNDEYVDTIYDEADEELAEAVERAEAKADAEPEAVFDSVYAELPDRLRKQRSDLLEFVEERDRQELEQ
jgi:pyruvate dehydrogenase E1 component alpha subunit